MSEPTDGVVEGLGWRKRLVTTLVGKDPKTCAKKTLDKGVESPKTCSDWRRCYRLGSDVGVEDVKGGCKGDDISGDIVETGRGRSLKAVCRYGISNLLDGVVWNGKFLAVAINQSSSLVLDWAIVCRVE